VVLAQSEDEINEAVARFEDEAVVGFDTETRARMHRVPPPPPRKAAHVGFVWLAATAGPNWQRGAAPNPTAVCTTALPPR
jgi:hypothetical protein